MSDYRPPRRDPSRKPPQRKPGERQPGERGEKSYPGERLAKVIARAGLASRRDAEAFITSGRVSVNGRVIDSPALNVGPADVVLVDGKPLPRPERTRLFLYHKPRGRITTERDPEGRPTVFDDLPSDLPRLMAVGRLDFNTEGLLLLTNDGGLKRLLELPSTGWLRRYRVRAFGRPEQAALAALAGGVTIDGITYGPVEAAIERVQGDNVWLIMGLREGKNREVRIILQHLGLEVNRLIRVSYGPFQLGNIEAGEVMEVKRRRLRDQLGERLAREAGVDFDGPAHVSPRPQPAPRDRYNRDHPPGRERDAKPPDRGRATAKAERYAGLQEEAVAAHSRPDTGARPHVRVERDAASGTLSLKPRHVTDSKGRQVRVARKARQEIGASEGERRPHVSKRPFREQQAEGRRDADRPPSDKPLSGERDDRRKGKLHRPEKPGAWQGYKDRSSSAAGKPRWQGFRGREGDSSQADDRPKRRDARPARSSRSAAPERSFRDRPRSDDGPRRGPRPPRPPRRG